MAKKAAFLLLLMLALCPLFSEDIRAFASSSTEVGSRSSAESNLAAMISNRISVEQRNYTYDNGSGDANVFSEEAFVGSGSISADLFGLKYSTTRSGDQCTTEIVIPDSYYDEYVSRASTALFDAIEIHSALEDDSLSSAEKIAYYESLLMSYEKYEVYCNVAKLMMPGKELDLGTPGFSYAVVRAQYKALLEKNGKDLDDEKARLLKNSSGLTEMEVSDKLSRVTLSINENNRKRLEEERKTEEWWQQEFQNISEKNMETAKDLAKKAMANREKADLKSSTSDDPHDMIASINAKEVAVRNISSDLESQKSILKAQWETEKTKKVNDMSDAKEWKAAELKADGKPTDQARKLFNQTVQAELSKIDSYYSKQLENLESSVSTESKNLEKAIKKEKDRLLSKTFSLDSRFLEVNVAVGRYDGELFLWPIYVSTMDGNAYKLVDLTYKEASGKDKPTNEASAEAWNRYYDEAEILNAFFQDTECNAIEAIAEYKLYAIEQDDGSETEFVPYFTKIKLIRADEGRVMKEQVFSRLQKAYQSTSDTTRKANFNYSPRKISLPSLSGGIGRSYFWINCGMGVGNVALSSDEDDEDVSLEFEASFEYRFRYNDYISFDFGLIGVFGEGTEYSSDYSINPGYSMSRDIAYKGFQLYIGTSFYICPVGEIVPYLSLSLGLGGYSKSVSEDWFWDYPHADEELEYEEGWVPLSCTITGGAIFDFYTSSIAYALYLGLKFSTDSSVMLSVGMGVLFG